MTRQYKEALRKSEEIEGVGLYTPVMVHMNHPKYFSNASYVCYGPPEDASYCYLMVPGTNGADREVIKSKNPIMLRSRKLHRALRWRR